MQFGHFDDQNKEYVIDRPDTPRSWSNYLGDTEYGAIITNNAGGYSFFQSAAQGRFMRMRFNSIPMDQPGRYLYLRDQESDDFWSSSWQPVGKSLKEYKTECRHGTAYSRINSEYNQIKSEALYFVPLGRHFEIWKYKITNQGDRKRSLRLFTFVEYANHWHIWNDFINLQYSQSILNMKVIDGIIDHGINVLLPDEDEEGGGDDKNHHTFLGVAGAEISGYDTDREIFLGRYGSYHNPEVIVNGECTNSLAVADNGCGVLQIDVELAPGESKELAVIMGIGKAVKEGKAAIQEFSDLNKIDSEFEKLKGYWHHRLEGMTVQTPDHEFDSMTNMWTPFNCLMTYSWSRAASLVYSGERDGLGYRDTVQDMLGVLHTIPEEAGERLELMITGQVASGGAMPVVKPFDHHPGKEIPPEKEAFRSDDCMWLFYTIPAYVKETGNLDFYTKVLPYADEGEDTILGHMKRAIEFSMHHSGAHGLPCGLYADWNDCLELGHEGETVFVALQLRYAFKIYIEICKKLQISKEIEWAESHLKVLDENLEAHAWTGEWYLRAFKDDGTKFGTQNDEEGAIWLNPQSWAVLSEHATPVRSEKIMDQVHEKLATKHGIMILDPPYEKADHHVVKAVLFNPGMKENAAIFCHTQGWAIIAETLLGRGDRAYQYYRSFMPAAYNEKAEVREIEPYVYCQYTHSKHSPRSGASRLPWLSGTASWSYFTATQYIMGIQPDYEGLVIDPCVPSEWTSFEATRRFRGKTIHVEFDNPKSVQKGIQAMTLNGKSIEGNFIPVDQLQDENKLKVTMG